MVHQKGGAFAQNLSKGTYRFLCGQNVGLTTANSWTDPENSFARLADLLLSSSPRLLLDHTEE